MTVSDVNAGLRDRASTIVTLTPSPTTTAATHRCASMRLMIAAMLGPPAAAGAAGGAYGTAGPAPGGGGMSFGAVMAGDPRSVAFDRRPVHVPDLPTCLCARCLAVRLRSGRRDRGAGAGR